MITIYGIPNCDTMKKAFAWLAAQDIAYRFHDFKRDGLEQALLDGWVEAVGWESLLNRRGMMWRKLPPEARENIDRASAMSIMLSTPSIIKRPVLDSGREILVGFSDTRYRELFG